MLTVEVFSEAGCWTALVKKDDQAVYRLSRFVTRSDAINHVKKIAVDFLMPRYKAVVKLYNDGVEFEEL